MRGNLNKNLLLLLVLLVLLLLLLPSPSSEYCGLGFTPPSNSNDSPGVFRERSRRRVSTIFANLTGSYRYGLDMLQYRQTRYVGKTTSKQNMKTAVCSYLIFTFYMVQGKLPAGAYIQKTRRPIRHKRIDTVVVFSYNSVFEVNVTSFETIQPPEPKLND